MRKVVDIIDLLVNVLSIIAGICLIFIMLITCIDVLGNAFGHPLLGVEELTSVGAAITIAFVLPLAHKNRAHIGIDFLYKRMGTKFKKIDDIIVSILNSILFFSISWQSYKYAIALKNAGEVTATLQIPKYFFLYGVFLGCSVVFLLCLKEFLTIIRSK